MKPVISTTSLLLTIVALAASAAVGCAAEVTPNDPGGSTTTVGGPSGSGGSGDDGTGGAGSDVGGPSYQIQSRRVGQQNPNHEQGTPNEGPQPNPWTGGGQQSNQAPTPHHGNFAAKSDLPSHE
jgi:hypothetical protein